MPDHGFHDLPSFEQLLQPLGQPPRMADQQPRALGRLHAAIAPVRQHDLRRLAREDAHLLQLAVDGVAVVRVARHRAHAHHQTFLGRHCDGHLDAKLVGRAGLALGDALGLRGMQRVQLALVTSLLRVQPSGDVQLGLKFGVDLSGLALHVSDDPAQPGPQLPDLALHAPVLLGVRVTARLVLGRIAYTRVALAQFDPSFLCRVHELLAGAVEQPAVGGVGDGLGLHGGVQHDLIQASALDDAALARGLDAVRQQPFAASLADALTPAHQARRVAGQFVLEVALAAEVLPIRVLAPALTNILVAERVHVLQVQQRGHQASGQRGPSGGGDELRAPLGLEGLPIDQSSKPNQLVTLVDQVQQLGAEQVVIGTFVGWLGTHQHLD